MPAWKLWRGAALAVLLSLPCLAQVPELTTDNLQEVIDATAAGGTIVLDGARGAVEQALTGESITYTGPISIDKDITLLGNDVWRPDQIQISGATLGDCQSNELQDGAFDESPDPAAWTETADGAAALPILGPPPASATAMSDPNVAWFRPGEIVLPEFSTLSQTLSVPVPTVTGFSLSSISQTANEPIAAGAAQLSFALKIVTPNPNDTITVYVDGTPMGSVIQASNAAYQGAYAPVNLDLTSYIGQQPEIKIEARIETASTPTIFYVDDVCLVCPGGVLGNEGFEEGDTGTWVKGGDAEIIDDSSNAFSPTWVAVLTSTTSASPESRLTFNLSIPERSGNGADTFALTIDGSTQPFIITEDDTTYDENYRQVVIDLVAAGVADGGNHVFTFESTISGRPTSTVFNVDDVCVNDCEVTVVNGDFEADPLGSGWGESTTSGAAVIIEDGARFASFRARSATLTSSLSQDVTLPSVPAAGLQFFLRTLTPNPAGDGLDSLSVLMDGDPNPLLSIHANEARYTGEDFVRVFVDVSAFADGAPHTLTFESKILGLDEPTTFIVDDVCLAETPLATVIEVAEDATLTLENVAITGGTIGVLALAGSTVEINRCYFTDLRDDAIALIDATGLVANSAIVNGAGHGVNVDKGTLTMAQCSIIDNSGDAVHVGTAGTALVESTLSDGNGGGMISEGGQFDVAKNYVHNSGTDYQNTTDLDPPPLDATAPPNYATPQVWRGKMAGEINSGRNGVPAALDKFRFHDFEDETRTTPREVGADEVNPGAALGWLFCNVAPNPVGKNQQVTIEIILDSLSLDVDSTLFLVPELDGDPGIDAGRIQVDFFQILSARRGIGTHTFTQTFVNGLLMDGLMTVYLLSSGVVYGLDHPSHPIDFFHVSVMTDDAIFGSQFVVDTTPPVLLTGNRAYSYVNSTTDFAAAPFATPPYPPAWEPGIFATPANGVTLGFGGSSTVVPKMFFNSASLGVNVSATFADNPPPDPQGLGRLATTAGFPSDLDPVASEFLVDGNGRALFPDRADAPRWLGQIEDLYPEIDGAGTTLGVTYIGDNFQGDYPAKLDVVWGLGGIDFLVDDATQSFFTPAVFGSTNSWHIATQFVAVDRAGNESEAADPIHLWWTTDALARITSNKYNGNEAAEPEFEWALDRGDEDPGPATPCDPIAQFGLWRAANPADPFNSSWIDLLPGPPSEWTGGRRIDAFTIVSNSPTVLLGDYLTDPDYEGQYLLIAVAGADEYGNRQTPGLPTGSLASLNDLVVDGIDYDVWFNPGQGEFVETSAEVRLWYNRLDAGIIRNIDEGERSFGATTRVPLLPEGACNSRIEAFFRVQVQQREIPFSGGAAEWALFEDGAVVAAGTLEGTGGYLDLQIPEDLFNPPAGLTFNFDLVPDQTAFLNLTPSPCGNIQNRFGDDGDKDDARDDARHRRRSVNYLFTARGVVADIADSTPAAVRFTVYVDEEEYRDEQAVKLFVRE